MPRCGCASGQQVLIQGEDPIVVTGDGSPGSPFVVSFAHGGRQGCEGVVACVGEHLGSGLGYNASTNTIGARLSSDAGNATTFGSDGGLMTVSGSTPIPEICAQKTVDSLLARDPCDLLVGAFRQAGLVQPFDAPYATEYCLANSFDLIHVKVAASSDGVGFLHYGGINTLFKSHTNVGLFNVPTNDLSSATVSNIMEWAGDPNDSGISTCVTTGCREQGGWWGFHAPPYTKVRLVDMLRMVGGRAVVVAEATANTAQEPANIAATVRAVQQACAQSWVLVAVRSVALADQVLAAGLRPIMIRTGHTAYQDPTLPWPIADLTRPGGQVEWVILQRNHADSVYAAYRDAGVHVLAQYVERHVERKRFECGADPVAQPALARGILSMDPVYTFGPERFDYRTTVDPMQGKGISPGILSHQTSRGILGTLGSGQNYGGGGAAWGRAGRGWVPEGDNALRIDPEFGLAPNGDDADTPGVLMGWSCPLPNPLEYTIEWQMQAIYSSNIPSRRRALMSLLIAGPDDRDVYQWPEGSPGGYPAQTRQIYRMYVRLDGSLGIGLWEPGTGDFFYLNGDNRTTTASEAEVSSPALVSEQYSTYRVTVTPTSVQLRRTLGGNQWTITANDTSWRGPYFYFEKRDALQSTGTPDPLQRFAGQVRSFTVNSLAP